MSHEDCGRVTSTSGEGRKDEHVQSYPAAQEQGVLSAPLSCKRKEEIPGSRCNFLPGRYFCSSLPPWVSQWVWELPCSSHADFGDFLSGQEDVVHLLFNGMRVDFGEKNKTRVELFQKSFPAMDNPVQPLLSSFTFIYPF